MRLVRPIDIEKLKRDRLQLIGESAHYETQGEDLVIPETMWPLARAEQEKRRIADPWEDILANIPDTITPPNPGRPRSNRNQRYHDPFAENSRRPAERGHGPENHPGHGAQWLAAP